MWLWLMKIPTQYQLIIPTGQSKTMWQCQWQIQVTNLKTSASGLMANIETNASCLAFSIVLWYCLILILFNKNIARGTTDPGYWFYNLSYHKTMEKARQLSLASILVIRPLADVVKLVTWICHWHCHIVLDCPVRIISWYWVGIFINQSYIS